MRGWGIEIRREMGGREVKKKEIRIDMGGREVKKRKMSRRKKT